MTAGEGEDDLKSSKIKKKDEHIQAKFKSSLKDSILSFWRGKHEQRSFQGIDGVPKTDERVVTFIMDFPARGTVQYIGDSTGNVYIIVGLELVGNHNFNLIVHVFFGCRVLLQSRLPILTQNY